MSPCVKKPSVPSEFKFPEETILHWSSWLVEGTFNEFRVECRLFSDPPICYQFNPSSCIPLGCDAKGCVPCTSRASMGPIYHQQPIFKLASLQGGLFLYLLCVFRARCIFRSGASRSYNDIQCAPCYTFYRASQGKNNRFIL